MIKNSTYIRGFSSQQRKNLEKAQGLTGFKTVPEILFFALDRYLEQETEIERLKRIVQYKQNKIERLENSG